MRWFWIDKFVEFESGQRAVALKNVTLGEPHVNDYVPGRALLPPSLVLEGLAQTGGVLVAEAKQFEHRVVLAKVSRASFPRDPRPGDCLEYTALLEQIQPDGAIVDANAHVNGTLVAQTKMVFAHLGQEVTATLFDPAELLQMLKLWRLFEVGHGPDGLPLKVPDSLQSHTISTETGRLLHAVPPSLREGRTR